MSFCGGAYSTKWCKRGERCYTRRTTIHTSAVNSITSQRGVDNGRSTMKGNGDGVAWNGSDSKEKTCNLRHSYTSRERY